MFALGSDGFSRFPTRTSYGADMPIRSGLLALCAVVLAVPANALAGAPGKWSLVSPNNEDNIDQVGLARTNDGVLHAIYALKGEQSISHTSIAANGTVGATTPVQEGWATIAAVPDLVAQPDGSLRAFFGGIHSTNTGDP